nr:reverse transcriptase domain-containing protein [Tanacetum cinerariifolium]
MGMEMEMTMEIEVTIRDMMVTEAYCPRNEIKKLEIELWNSTVKGTDVVRPKILQEAIGLANSLMDQKVRAYAARKVDNEKRMDNNPKDNHVQQSPYKRQNIMSPKKTTTPMTHAAIKELIAQGAADALVEKQTEAVEMVMIAMIQEVAKEGQSTLLQNDSATLINFNSEDEDEESTPQPQSQNPKLVKETLIPKPYKPKFPYPQHLRKEKMEARYGKFLDMIRAIRINVPLFDVLAGMPTMGNFSRNS